MACQATEGIFSPFLLHRRLQAVRGLLRGMVLDVGCGAGQLAHFVDPMNYFGVDIDETSLQVAKKLYPSHAFVDNFSKLPHKFETIVALAVIEHMSNPVEFLLQLKKHMDDLPTSRIIVSTPHPSLEWCHSLGAKFGLFSKHAHDEHQSLLGKSKLIEVGKNAGLKIESYDTFLFGVNQLAIYSK